MGHSLGGLFACYLFTQKKSLFQRYLVSSPALRQGDFVTEKWFSERLLEDPPEKRSFFLSVGNLENWKPVPNGPSFKEAVERGRNIFQKHAAPKKSFRYKNFPGKTHENVFPEAVKMGLRYLIGVD